MKKNYKIGIALGGGAAGKTLNMAIASANRPKYLTTSDYMQG